MLAPPLFFFLCGAAVNATASQPPHKPIHFSLFRMPRSGGHKERRSVSAPSPWNSDELNIATSRSEARVSPSSVAFRVLGDGSHGNQWGRRRSDKGWKVKVTVTDQFVIS